MKHPEFLNNIVLNIESFFSKTGAHFSNFHPSLFTPLFRLINKRALLIVEDSFFESILKHLSPFWDDDSYVFIGTGKEGRSPVGFVSEAERALQRATNILSSGKNSCSVIVCSVSGQNINILGSGRAGCFILNESAQFDDCIYFLENENYRRVDSVYSPGEFCVRGGIIDVFPISKYSPYRLNFLDNPPKAFRFNAETQLTISETNSFNISSSFADKRTSIKKY